MFFNIQTNDLPITSYLAVLADDSAVFTVSGSAVIARQNMYFQLLRNYFKKWKFHANIAKASFLTFPKRMERKDMPAIIFNCVDIPESRSKNYQGIILE